MIETFWNLSNVGKDASPKATYPALLSPAISAEFCNKFLRFFRKYRITNNFYIIKPSLLVTKQLRNRYEE
jgi:hypothetical protein